MFGIQNRNKEKLNNIINYIENELNLNYNIIDKDYLNLKLTFGENKNEMIKFHIKFLRNKIVAGLEQYFYQMSEFANNEEFNIYKDDMNKSLEDISKIYENKDKLLLFLNNNNNI